MTNNDLVSLLVGPSCFYGQGTYATVTLLLIEEYILV